MIKSETYCPDDILLQLEDVSKYRSGRAILSHATLTIRKNRIIKSSTSPITASPISPSVFRMWREDLKCVTVFSKAVSHPKTSAIFGNREKRERNALYSRA